MKRILKIGMNIHTTNYTLCAMEPIIGEADSVFETIKVTSDYKNILLFIENMKMMNTIFSVDMRRAVLDIHSITS